MSTGRVPATGSSPLTTKGDLYTYSTTQARLAVGNNGETLVADSSATTGLRWTSVGLANPIINGGMDIWQRGTSFSLAASTAYTAGAVSDRWQTKTGTNQACTISRQTTSDTTNLPNIQYCLRYQRNSGQTGTGALTLAQSLESTNAIPFAGKVVTLSFYARKGADYSAASSVLKSFFVTGTGTDQNAFAGYTGEVNTSQDNTLTTTWQRFSQTHTIPTTATEFAVFTQFIPVGTASTNDYYEVTGVQIDVGSVALPFRRSGGTLAGEFQACQRYFERYAASDFGDVGSIPQGLINVNNANLPETNLLYSRKRVKPTITFSNGDGFQAVNVTAGNVARTTSFYGTFDGTGLYSAALVFNATWTAGQATYLQFYDANQYIDISAEL